MNEAIARYPQDRQRSAALPLLHLWQEHFGSITDAAVDWISARLSLQPINILELVTFYPMLRQHRAGRTHIRVCRTLSCAMAGSYRAMENLCAATGIVRHPDGNGMHDPISVSADGNYSIEFVECLASCGTAPVCMVNDELHENVPPANAEKILTEPEKRRGARSSSTRTSSRFQKHRTQELEARHRLLLERRWLRTTSQNRHHVPRLTLLTRSKPQGCADAAEPVFRAA